MVLASRSAFAFATDAKQRRRAGQTRAFVLDAEAAGPYARQRSAWFPDFDPGPGKAFFMAARRKRMQEMI